jgi:hypothetical protein
MDHFFRTVIDWLQTRRATRDGFRIANKTAFENAVQAPPGLDSKSDTFLWTAVEAEAAWRAGRTEYNLGETFDTFAKSLEWMAGNFLVDNKRARVVICTNQRVKKRVPFTLLDKQSRFAIPEEQRWLEPLRRSQVTRTPKTMPEIQGLATCAETIPAESLTIKRDSQPAPLNAEVRCVNCHATRAQLENRGQSTCCAEPFWTVPYELIYRSLPGGEDR